MTGATRPMDGQQGATTAHKRTHNATVCPCYLDELNCGVVCNFFRCKCKSIGGKINKALDFAVETVQPKLCSKFEVRSSNFKLWSVSMCNAALAKRFAKSVASCEVAKSRAQTTTIVVFHDKTLTNFIPSFRFG